MPQNKKEQTIESYNKNAQALAKKFDSLGARTKDIEETFLLTKKDNPNVLEVGCGNGRDASEIIKHTNKYLGIDISEKLIGIAQQKLPQTQFQMADIENYDFPQNLDIIFAFASLIHVPKESLKKILSDAFLSLNENGIIRLSMKYADAYAEITKEDEFGVRTYYLYSKEDIIELANGFKIIKNDLHDLKEQKWLEIIFKK